MGGCLSAAVGLLHSVTLFPLTFFIFSLSRKLGPRTTDTEFINSLRSKRHDCISCGLNPNACILGTSAVLNSISVRVCSSAHQALLLRTPGEVNGRSFRFAIDGKNAFSVRCSVFNYLGPLNTYPIGMRILEEWRGVLLGSAG